MSYPIFIAPLPRHFTSAELAALFRPFGRVVLAKVIYDSVGQSLQYGRVQMETDEGADNACRHLDRTIFHKTIIYRYHGAVPLTVFVDGHGLSA